MLKSMTGFGRASGRAAGLNWSWELRSVNGKGLDIRLRLPMGYETLEQKAKKLLARGLSRGNIQASLLLTHRGGKAGASLNEDVLASALEAISKIEAISERAPSSAAEILNAKGVFDTSEQLLAEEAQLSLEAELLHGLENAAVALNKNRAEEGAALAKVLLGHIQTVRQLTGKAEQDASRTPAAITERLRQQLETILGASDQFDQDRLHQEAVLLATKADIREELDRLMAHSAAAEEMIQRGSPAGRKLEFISQEFNRECNTVCSKANALSLKEIGLELKVVIDQFREQSLNVE